MLTDRFGVGRKEETAKPGRRPHDNAVRAHDGPIGTETCLGRHPGAAVSCLGMGEGAVRLRRVGIAALGLVSAVVLVPFAHDFLFDDTRMRSWSVTRGVGSIVLLTSVVALAWTSARSWRSGRLGPLAAMVGVVVLVNSLAAFGLFGFPAY